MPQRLETRSMPIRASIVMEACEEVVEIVDDRRERHPRMAAGNSIVAYAAIPERRGQLFDHVLLQVRYYGPESVGCVALSSLKTAWAHDAPCVSGNLVNRGESR
jgi:hypothetical protein